MGEIIRIHRCNIGQFKSNKTFFVNMGYGSSWIIFEGVPKKASKTAVQAAVMPVSEGLNSEEEEDVEMSSGDLASDNETH